MKYKVNFLMITANRWCHVIITNINQHHIHDKIRTKFGDDINQRDYKIYKIEAITE